MYMYKEKLKQFGLNASESELYLYLLENGDSSVNSISTETTIGRTNVYDYAKSLKDKGLIDDYEKQGKIFYRALSPLELERVINSKKDELSKLNNTYESIISKLKDMYYRNTELSRFEYFIGDEGYRNVCNRIFLEGNDDKLIYFIKDINLYEPLEPRYRSAVYNRRLITYLLTNIDELPSEFTKRDGKEYRITKKVNLDIKEDILIYENLCFIGNFEKKNFKMTCIENASLSIILKSFIN